MKTTVLRAVAIPFALALSMSCTGNVREADGGGGAATTTTVSGGTTSTSSGGGTTGTAGGNGGSNPPDANPGVVDVCQDLGVDGPVFAIRKLSLGDLDLDGTKSDAAWKHYGFDVDGHVSTDKLGQVMLPGPLPKDPCAM